MVVILIKNSNVCSHKLSLPNIQCENIPPEIKNPTIKPIINSGYRSPVLNKKIGGSNTSDHCKGMAADIVINGLDNYVLACFIKDNLKFKQVILEFYNKTNNLGWVHISYDNNDLKCQQLTAIKVKGKTIYNNVLII